MFNDDQKRAVQTTEGPVRIIGGAGSGKTHTLIARIQHLIESESATPYEILALTFTNKAAHEITKKLHKNRSPEIHSMTFHGLAAHWLRRFWKPDFKILNSSEEEEILREILYSAERDDLKNVIIDLNNVRQSVACEANWPRLLSTTSLQRLAEIWRTYRKILDEHNATDFTGLLTTLVELWKNDPKILEQCQSQYHYVMIDDYQDMSPIQVKIVQKICSPKNGSTPNICIAGDEDQAIYSWRGAQHDTMEEFAKLFPETTTITLTQNYRNPPSILNGASQLIAYNETRLEKPLKPTLDVDHPITLWESHNEWQMNKMLFHLFEQFFGDPDINHNKPIRSFSDIAILYRTQAEGRLLAAHLSKKEYPFQMSTMTDFWEHAETYRFLEKLNALRNTSTLSQKETGSFSDWFQAKIEEFIWHQSIPEKKAKHLLQLLPYAASLDHLDLPEALSQFLDEADTAQDADNLIHGNKINLLTLHASKGLEFPIILIIGLEEGRLPHDRLSDDEYWLAEERRLLYVGMTRATEQLHLFTNKTIESNPLEPSRFINEIGTKHLTYGKLPEKKMVPSLREQVKKGQISIF